MRALAATLVAYQIAGAQSPPPDEVRVSSRPYIPFHLRIDTNLVEVSVVVRDRAGRAIAGLKQADFQLFEEGKPREIVSFSAESHPSVAAAPPAADAPGAPSTATAAARRPQAPRFIALFFDDLGTGLAELAFTRKAAKQFLETSLQADDRVALFTTSSGRVTEFTNDRAQLAAAADRIQTRSRFSQTDSPACPRITPYDAYKMVMLKDEDAIHSAITEMSICGLGMPTAPATPKLAGRVNPFDPSRNIVLNQAEQIWTQVRNISENTIDALSRTIAALTAAPGSKPPATRMLLLVSSGFLTGTLEREQDLLVDQALRSGVVINSLDAKGLFAEPPGRPFGEDQGTSGTPPEVFFQETLNAVDRNEAPSSVLAALAVSTGGLYFHHNNGFSEGFRELGATPEASYMLGFHAGDAALDSKYHKLKVCLASSSAYDIQARPGYFAVLKPTPAEEEGRTKLEREVTGSKVLNEIRATVAGEAGDTKSRTGLAQLHVKMHVDLTGLEFPVKDGRRIEKLTFVFALLDKESTIVAAREGTMEFAASEAKYTSLMNTGVNAVLTLEAPSGSYRLRAVAIDGVKLKMAALIYAIKLP